MEIGSSAEALKSKKTTSKNGNWIFSETLKKQKSVLKNGKSTLNFNPKKAKTSLEKLKIQPSSDP